MTPFEALSQQDIDMFKNFVSQYAGYPEVSMERLLSPWNREKENLFHMLGDKLMISRKINYVKGIEDIINEMERTSFFSHPFIAEIHKYIDRIRIQNRNSNTWWDIENPEYAKCLCLNSLIDADNLASNIYNLELTANFGSFKVTPGMKASKALGKIAAMLGPEAVEKFENFRIQQSQLLNNKKLMGDLVISIHPLDFATASMNNCGWTSCMSWDGGEYRLGTVEMMNSPVIVCAYLTAKGEFRDYNCIWNNKKWREFFIIDEDYSVIGIKGYPYINRDLEKEVLNILAELKSAQNGLEYAPAQMFGAYKFNTVNECDGTGFHYDFRTHFMYNDFNSEHQIRFTNNLIDFTNKTTTGCHNIRSLLYSGPTEALDTGYTSYDYDEDNFVADNLCHVATDRFTYCDECGMRIDTEYDNYQWIDDRIVCADCLSEYYSYCVSCNSYHDKDDMVYIHYAKKLTTEEMAKHKNCNIKIYSHLVNYVCENCLSYGGETEIKDHQAVVVKSRWTSEYNVVFEDEISDSDFRRCFEYDRPFILGKNEWYGNNCFEYGYTEDLPLPEEKEEKAG